jgi:folylpolyglutamate synthase
LKVQKELAEMWKKIDPAADVKVTGTIEEALNFTREALDGKEGLVLVTGSLHLVGGAIEVLQSGGMK